MKTKEELQAQLDELQRQINEVKEDKIDFSEFVGINAGAIVIKGEKCLKSLPNGDILYSHDVLSLYNKTPDYIETTIDKLEVGDVFIRVDNVGYMIVGSFKIMRGNDDNGNGILTQYIGTSYSLEIIESFLYLGNTDIKVYKFLRN